ncbi:hypothetical protein BGZ97_003520 [Linnemannia gamsii]|uniref:FAR1 domain-containing protein n=1 Tax=Linnemannia gamsii TaxID=64522 RepID=A0A9P6UHJ5_9FUNG|nr:hypothetical protein BGZ97_003520 [Linnemannia gamsii]
MDDFYDRLLGMSFEQSNDAITKCRDLAREHGFTVKQETSSNKNVYLYCSREGVPDSVKNNKEIKRKRLSMRCDCKWRITLFQQESKLWIFRKAMNPASMVHNHPLISPDDIRQPWPAAVFDRIAFYANQRNLTTSETRERIKEDFPDLVWDERRFYNRLTEERKQIRLRDSESRVFSTMDLAARVASLASADPSLSYKVTSSLENVLVEICEQLRIDPAGAGSRVLTSPPSSAGGGGSGGVTGAGGMGASNTGLGGIGSSSSMNMTSPTSASSGFCSSSSSSSPLSPSDYVVTYPGCVISVKNTPNQKGRPSSISSPGVDSSYGLGLGMSPLNDRKRSLSEECFTRHGIGGSGPSGATPSFGSAMTASQMISQLDMSTTPLQGALSGLDSSGLLMMQSGGYHPHGHPHQQHPHQVHPQQQQQQQQQQQLYHQQQQESQQHHGSHHLPSGMAAAFRPAQAHHHSQHQQHHHPHHPLGQSNDLSSALDLDAAEAVAASRAEPSSSMRRTHSVDIKQEMQSFYQPMLATPQLSAPPQPQRRSGSSPGTMNPNQHQQQQQQQRLYAQQYTSGGASAGFPSSNQLGDSDDVFSSQVSFSAAAAATGSGAADQYHFNAGPHSSSGSSSGGHQGGGGGGGGHHYLHPGYANPQTSSSPTMSAGGGSSSSLGPH